MLTRECPISLTRQFPTSRENVTPPSLVTPSLESVSHQSSVTLTSSETADGLSIASAIDRQSFDRQSFRTLPNWGHIRHPSAVRAVCGQFKAENRGDRRITLRVPQGVGLNHRGRAVENQWSWAVERFANMFANQSTVRDLPTDMC